MNTAAAAVNGGVRVDRRVRSHNNHQPLNCPRCDSINTKFCYYNNYNLSQPRHFCKNCRRYWTHGGVLRNVPIGGGCRKSNRRKRRRSPPKQPPSSSESATTATAAAVTTTSVHDGVLQCPDNDYNNPRLFSGGFVSLMNNNNNNNNNNNITDDNTASFGEIFEPKIDELMENRGGYGGIASTVDNWKDNQTTENEDQGLFEFGSVGVFDDRIYWNQSMNAVEDHTNWGRNSYDYPLFLP